MICRARARTRLCALRRDRRGLALTEFALSLPLVLLLVLTGLEFANFALAHLRVGQIAMTTVDNAGRVRTTIDEVNIREVFAGAELIGRSIDFAENGRIVLSSLRENGRTGTREGQEINWQRCFGELEVDPSYGVEGDGGNDASLREGLGPEGNRITSAPNTAVMFVEVTYDYQPLIGLNWLRGATRIRHESAFNVRERTNQNITNTQNLSVSDCED